MVDCKLCKNKDTNLFDALESIVWYDGHYVWLKKVRDDMVAHPKDKNFLRPSCLSGKRDTEEYAIWMLLIGMYGNWGVSIGAGWIENLDGCIEFINALCKDAWEIEEGNR